MSAFQQHSSLSPASSSEYPFLDPPNVLFWAQEGLKALKTSNRAETKHIIQFIPIGDQYAVEEVLQSRWDSELDVLLATEIQASSSDTSLTQRQTLVQELVALLLPRPAGNIWPTAWVPLNPNVKRPAVVAEDVHDTVVDTFCKIGLGDWARYASGFEVPAVAAFFQWASTMSKSLRVRYADQSKELYEQVEKKLRNRDPIAHWILASSLDLTSIEIDAVLQPLVCAIRDFYSEKLFELNHLIILNRQFSGLLERYDGDWLTLAGDFSFIRLVISGSRSPKDISRCMADRALAIHAQFKLADFGNKDLIQASLKKITRPFNLLRYMVQDCVDVIPNLYDVIFKTALYSHEIRDFFSTVALLLGLRHSELRYPGSKIWNFIDHKDHYYNLFVEWEKPMPGIPFLPSLHNQSHDVLIAEFFRFITYKAWLNKSMTFPHNRTCYPSFAFVSFKLYERISRWVDLRPLMQSRPAPSTVGDEKLSLSQESFSSQVPAWRLSPKQELNGKVVHRLPYAGVITERNPPFQNTTLSMTDDEVHNSYTFVHLSSVTEYRSDVRDHLDGRLGDLQELPSVFELPDENWELVVHQLHVSELCNKLKRLFPSCQIFPDYDPTIPSVVEIEKLGCYHVAKWSKEREFVSRAEVVMEEAWPIAAEYYKRWRDIILRSKTVEVV